MRRLLLISNSTQHGSGYLDHCAEEIRAFLPAGTRVAFVPHALADHDAYAATVEERFRRLGFALTSVHAAPDPPEVVREAGAIFVGGGNTFRLLDRLYRTGLLQAIREAAEAGTPYLGSSAGTNVACPSIRTTNDMPIVMPPSLDALGLVPFQINPHYVDPVPGSTHMGETREQRIREFHEENPLPVVGLREGALLRVVGRQARLAGARGARLFRRGEAPREVGPEEPLDFLLG